MRFAVIVVGTLAVALATAPSAHAGAMVRGEGCSAHFLARNDDGSSARVALPFAVNFLGAERDGLYVNNNGNVTFDAPLATYTPFSLQNAAREIIAPYFADVDTRNAASDVVRWGTTSFEGRTAFCVLWDGVGYYNARADRLNRFELLLVDRSDVSAGDFDIVFNYDAIAWEAGDASGGTGGLGGSSARAGYSNGSGADGTSLELEGSGQRSAFLDGGAHALISGRRNTLVDGRYVFPMRNGFEVPNQAPVARLHVDGNGGAQPARMVFDGSASEDPDGELVAWRLDFGDGSEPATGTGAPPAALEHVYRSRGHFTARLTVTDDKGAEATATEHLYTVRGPVEVTARPALLDVVPGAEAPLGELRARLVHAGTGEPLAGRDMSFSAGLDILCEATTDTEGWARCRSSTALLAHREYVAGFHGDDDHASGTGKAPLVRAGGAGLP